MIQRRITLSGGWLHLPIGRDAQCWYVQFEVDGQPFAEFYLGLVPDHPDFYCGMELAKYTGQEITMTAQEGAPANLLDGIVEGGAMDAGNPLYPNLYHEPLRPQVHFSSRRGWINDPNGLFYDGENYHLYYQHNPYGILHGGVNIHWGHAVSRDAIHWEEHSDALRPWISRCHIASGSCIMDREGVAGYGKNAVIAAFTHLGSRNFCVMPEESYPSDGQFLAYSTDGGETFTLFPDNPAIPTVDGQSWRDPRIFAHPDGGFGIAVYETTEKGNCVSFYHSDDLHHWTQTSRANDLYECPDLFELTPVNGGGSRWVLYGADGMYRIGDFTGGAFHQEGGRLPLDYGPSTYAGQTWNGRDDSDGRMHISWLHFNGFRSAYPDEAFSQCMTVPCLLTLVKTEDGYRLNRNPIPAFAELRTGVSVRYDVKASGDATITPNLPGDALLTIDSSRPIEVLLEETCFTYDPQTGAATFPKKGHTIALQKKGPMSLRMITDATSCEFFLQGEISATFGALMAGQKIVIRSEGDFTVSGTGYNLKSIWP